MASVGFLLFLCSRCAVAAMHIDNSTTGIGAGFNNFITKIEVLISHAITDPNFLAFIDMLFIVFVVILVVFTFAKYSFRAAPIFEIYSMIVMILMVRMLMQNFDPLTSGIWQSAEGVSGSLQNSMLGTSDMFFAPRFLAKVMQSISLTGGSAGFDLGAMFEIALNTFALSAVMMLLSILSYTAAIWGFWGYALAKLIGLIFVPTLLFERLSFLFDGWLRFFFGFVVYYIVARMNLVLVACAVSLFLGLGLPPQETTVATEIPTITSLFEMIGLLTFLFVGILALFSTGRFAATIVAGSAGGGMGAAMLGVARFAGKVAGSI